MDIKSLVFDRVTAAGTVKRGRMERKMTE